MNYSSVFKVLVVGCGDLGSRHIQGLLKSNQRLDILGFDKSLVSINRCQQRIASEDCNFSDKSVEYTDSLVDFKGHWHLVIVATTSLHRLSAISEIRKYISFDYLVLEKLLARTVSELDNLMSIMTADANVWVNCPRRVMDWHKSIRRIINRDYSVQQCEINIGGHELATNVIHFIDFASWLYESPPLKCIYKNLGEWQLSKRNGFYDLSGTLSFEYQNGKELSITCIDQPVNTTIRVSDSASDQLLFVDEIIGSAIFKDGSTVHGILEYQSFLTGKIADDILINGSCGLPTLSDSYLQHLILLELFEDHWENSSCVGLDSIPLIT